MCNAWNHPPGCTCGWGGEGHLGRRAGDFEHHSFHYSTYTTPFPYESYVNPNARCPVCGDSVYFYQSPYGGKVFFDDLGPPWPKHPCTDNTLYYNSISSIDRTGKHISITNPGKAYTDEGIHNTPQVKHRWHHAGWHPLVCDEIRETRGQSARILGRVLFREKGGFRKSHLITVYVSSPPCNLGGVPLYIREHPWSAGNYEMGTFTLSPDNHSVDPISMPIDVRTPYPLRLAKPQIRPQPGLAPRLRKKKRKKRPKHYKIN